MVYEMRLKDRPYDQIRRGEKSIELRLFDLKRRRLNPGDIIIFYRISSEKDFVASMVKALYRFRTFEDLFEVISMEECGFSESTSKEDAVRAMRVYYSPDNEKALGVVGIKLELINPEDAFRRIENIYSAEIDRLFPDGMK